MADIMRVHAPKETVKVGDDEMSFYGFLRWTLATHSNYNTEGAGIRAGVRLERVLTDEPATFDLDQPDFERLRQAVESPNGGYPVRPATRLLPYVDAVANARPHNLPQEAPSHD